VTINEDLIRQAMVNPDVVQHLKDHAEKVRDRAEQLAAADNVDAEFTTEEMRQSTGRPVVDVRSNNAEAEYGTSRVDRRRVLGRAAEEFRTTPGVQQVDRW
jgi:hypothetical protein